MSGMSGLAVLRGEQRHRLAAELADRFVRDAVPIGELAVQARRRPTTVRRLLGEAGVRTTDLSCVGAATGEIVAALGARYRAGASIRALAADTGIDRRAIRELLAGAGVVLRARPPSSADRIDWLVGQYQAGATLRGLAATLDCSHSTVRRWLLRAGVVLRPPAGGQANRPGVA
jgi:hypothetical protein